MVKHNRSLNLDLNRCMNGNGLVEIVDPSIVSQAVCPSILRNRFQFSPELVPTLSRSLIIGDLEVSETRGL